VLQVCQHETRCSEYEHAVAGTPETEPA
jgi:hypothetical protein